MEQQSNPNILLVGVGGIGGMTIELLAPALERIQSTCTITLMDGDIVEATNLGHQRFTKSDIGKPKTEVLAQKFTDFEYVTCHSVPENLRTAEQLEGYDFILIGVDRPLPRRLVHVSEIPWIDMRSTGDGHVYFTNESHTDLVTMMTPDHEPASCQIKGALEVGNIQFGYVNAAAAGATWLIGRLRNQPVLKERMGSIMFGELKFPEVSA
jgi:hypothetical protein